MDSLQLEGLIAESLKNFYDRRLQALGKVKLRTFLRRKNPYLLRSRALEKASDVVEQLLVANLQASDETIFGDVFFEPIAKAVSGGVVSPTLGVDIAIETKNRYKAIALKSGPNVFNHSQKLRQNDEFNSLRGRLLKLNKQFDPLLGHAYGRTRQEPDRNRVYRVRSGQAFWAEITGDQDFYLKLIRLMKGEPEKREKEFREAWGAVVNRLTLEFIADFCYEDGRIDWEKLTQFISAEKPPELPRPTRRART